MMNYKTSNPVFTPYFWSSNKSVSNKMTVRGIFFKTMTCLIMIALVTVCIWKLQAQGTDVSWFTYGGMIAVVIISVIISYKPYWASFMVPLYSIAKGCFLGGFSAYVKVRFPEMPYQAIGVTIVTFFVMLILYQTRIVVVTKQLRSVVITAATSIFVVYLISFFLELFGIKSFIWGTSWVAIVFNCIAALVASISLLLDFDFIERHKYRASKHKEWLATWGLLATLVWLYVEILRLMRKLAIKF